MGAGVEGQRQLHDMLEIIRQHGLTLAVRQSVGVKSDGGAAQNDEQTEGRPGRQQRPRRGRSEYPCGRLARENIDDATEQHRFSKLRAG